MNGPPEVRHDRLVLDFAPSPARARSAAGPIVIEARRSIAALEDVRADMDRLVQASARRCPFSTPAYLARIVALDEFLAFDGTDATVLVLLAYRGGELVGYLPLRERPERLLLTTSQRIELLVTHDNERPHVVAAPEDEDAVARAFIEHLCFERRVPFVDITGQEPGSALERAAFAIADASPPGQRFRARRLEGPPVSVVPIRWSSLDEYWRDLSRKHRSNVGRFGRRLALSGDLSWIESDEPRAVSALFDIYLSLEERSWKSPAQAGISRHEKRVRFFRRMIEEAQPKPWLGMAAVDGVPVAAILNGSFGGRAFALEMVYDEKYAHVAPGQILLLMGMRRAIAEGASSYNLLQSYAYYKTRWLADAIPTGSVQLLKVGSQPFYRAALGDLRRVVQARIDDDTPPVAFNEEKRAANVDFAAGREAARTEDARRLRVLVEDGLVQVTGGAALVDALPFLRG